MENMDRPQKDQGKIGKQDREKVAGKATPAGIGGAKTGSLGAGIKHPQGGQEQQDQDAPDKEKVDLDDENLGQTNQPVRSPTEQVQEREGSKEKRVA